MALLIEGASIKLGVHPYMKVGVDPKICGCTCIFMGGLLYQNRVRPTSGPGMTLIVHHILQCISALAAGSTEEGASIKLGVHPYMKVGVDPKICGCTCIFMGGLLYQNRVRPTSGPGMTLIVHHILQCISALAAGSTVKPVLRDHPFR